MFKGFKFIKMCSEMQSLNIILVYIEVWTKGPFEHIFLKCIFLKEKFCILIKISPKFVCVGSINESAFVSAMALVSGMPQTVSCIVLNLPVW